MAAFTADDPGDREAFDNHRRRVLSNPENTFLAIISDGELVGTIGCYRWDGATEVTYWVARPRWGEGIATRALFLLLEDLSARPLRARAASDNVASLRVLEKAGFGVLGTMFSYAPAEGRKSKRPYWNSIDVLSHLQVGEDVKGLIVAERRQGH